MSEAYKKRIATVNSYGKGNPGTKEALDPRALDAIYECQKPKNHIEKGLLNAK